MFRVTWSSGRNRLISSFRLHVNLRSSDELSLFMRSGAVETSCRHSGSGGNHTRYQPVTWTRSRPHRSQGTATRSLLSFPAHETRLCSFLCCLHRLALAYRRCRPVHTSVTSRPVWHDVRTASCAERASVVYLVGCVVSLFGLC